MTRHPVVNSLAAALYIVIVAAVMSRGRQLPEPEETILVPIAVISLFTLSAAVMGYLFLCQPLRLYLAGETKRAVNLFLQTVAIFAGITALLFAALFAGFAAIPQ